MLFKSFAAAAIVASTFISSASAAWDLTKKSNSVVYWGQNGGFQVDPTKQQDLLTTCNNTNIDVVVVGFVTKFKGKSGFPIINLSNQCGGYLQDPVTKNDTDILNCPHIGDAITQCQALGKKIILSLGGATYTDAGWADVNAARSSANEIWAMFGPPGSTPFKYRPFGLATVDGWDLDFEHTQNAKNAPAFAIQLRNKFATNKARTYYLTAAPQCVFPDATLGPTINAAVFDALFIQFYNNACGSQTWAKGKAQTSNGAFNMQMWQNWVQTTSPNKNIKLFTGFIAGNVNAQTTGYVAAATAQRIVGDSQRWANYGGASFWDSSILNINSAYLGKVRDALNNPANYNKRDLGSVEARDIKTPIGGASDLPAEEFIEHKVEADVVGKRRRRHAHHRRSF